jgi:hypothetical protein
MKYDYYTQTKGFEEVKISLSQAIKICKQSIGSFSTSEIKSKLHNPEIGEMESGFVRVWAEEKM